MDKINFESLLLDLKNKNYQKILILGCPGAGKTTLALKLKRALPIPLFHMDDLYWLPGWNRPNEHDFLYKLEEILNQSAWIIDGNYYQYLSPRLQKSDAIILVDINKNKCFYRVFKRFVARLFGDYSSLPMLIRRTTSNRVDFRMTYRLIKNIYHFSNKTMPKMIADIKQLELPIYILD